MAIAGRLAKGALDALGGKKYTGKRTTGQRAKDITKVALKTPSVKGGRRTPYAIQNKTGQRRDVSAGGVGDDTKAAMRVRKGALGTAAIAGGAAALSSKGDEKAKATEKPTTKKQGQTAFEKAFRRARREGKKTFMFEGKKYTTDLRKPRQPSPRSKPKAPTQKAYGGKVMKRMGGGNTMYRKYGGSVGEQMVAACYKDKGVS
tara:strand:- start:9 stop:617 length:609 start_codon:yes stop_codon:yes gene_type:complete